MRVLYLSMSPDGSTIVTGAGDETLRFWSVFPSVNDRKPQFQSSVEYGTISLRWVIRKYYILLLNIKAIKWIIPLCLCNNRRNTLS